MSNIIIDKFVGEAVREQKLTTHNIAADCAINAQLHDGALRPIPCPEPVCEHAFIPRFIHDLCECGAYPNETFFGQTQKFVLWAEQGHHVKKSNCYCEGEVVGLGLPCPEQPLHASGSSAGCGFDPHVYYYTWVAKFCGGCESEGPLSPASNEACGPANLSGGSAPPVGLGITHRRIYRASPGWKPGDSGTIKNNSGATLVAEVGVSGSVSDPVAAGQDGFIAPITQRMKPMPTNATGVGVSGFGVFAWQGSNLYISAEGMIDVRHPEGKFCFDHDILAATYWRGSIYVMTERWNYRIDESRGEGVAQYSNPPYRYEQVAPIHNPYSVTTGASGVYYIAKSGVVVLAGNESASIGSALFATSQWRSMQIDNAKLQVYQQYLFIYSRDWGDTHIFEIEDGVFSDISYSNHVRYPYSISATHITNDGDLLFASGSTTYRFVEEPCHDRTDCDEMAALCMPCCPYDYTISTRHAVEITDFAAAYLHIDPFYGDVIFRLWDGECGDKLIYEKVLQGCDLHEFKLPGCGPLSKYHTVQLEGCATIYEMRIGTNNKTLGLNR